MMQKRYLRAPQAVQLDIWVIVNLSRALSAKV